MGLLHILGSSPPLKVGDRVVGSIVVLVQNYHVLARWLWWAKQLHNELVEWWFFTFAVPSKIYTEVFAVIVTRLTYIIRAVRLFASHTAFIAYFVWGVFVLLPGLFRVGKVPATLLSASHPPAIGNI
jgi:hypothetical protein